MAELSNIRDRSVVSRFAVLSPFAPRKDVLSRSERRQIETHYGRLDTRHKGHDLPASSASFRTVFQFRAVPRVPSFCSMSLLVNFEVPIPAG